MSEVPLYPPRLDSADEVFHGVEDIVRVVHLDLEASLPRHRPERRACRLQGYRGYSTLRTRTAPRVVLCSQAYPYRRTLGRCVFLISSNPCTSLTRNSFPLVPYSRPVRRALW